MKILLVMMFWWDGEENSTRLRNVHFAWKELKNLHSFLKTNHIDCVVKLYDFSPDKMLEESNHIPYGLGEFKKSEKINKILGNNKDFNFIFMFDGDVFFNKDDYCRVLDTIQQLNSGDIITFDAAKLEEKDVDSIISTGLVSKVDVDWWYAYSGEKKHGPLSRGDYAGLGGAYLCDLSLLVKCGGFNESYVGWGGEDNEMLKRIKQSGIPCRHLCETKYSPFHLPHFSDWNNEKYYKNSKK